MRRLIIIIFPLMLMQAGCNGLLEENPKGLMAPEGFFKTPADVEAAVYGAYAEWVTLNIEKEYLLSLILRSDMAEIGDRNTTADRVVLNDFNMDARNSMTRLTWNSLFQAIAAANTAIKGARQISADQAVKNKLEGQARFIRAFTYYHLVRYFGDVPYMDVPVESAEELDAATRTPESEVYEHIIADLKFARENLPDRNPADVRNIGTRGSAATTLAEVYLTLHRYSEAAAEARYVIQNAASFNFALEKNYQDLFNANLSGTLREPIFTLDLKNNLSQGGYNPMEGLINLTRIRDHAPRSLSVAVPAYKVYSTWDARDYRRKVSFEDSVMIKGVKTALTDSKYRTPVPHIAKYFRYPGPQESGDDRSSDHHYCLFRYADVLLMAAEAIAESEGPTPEAIGYVNQVRERARFNGTTVTNFPADVSLDISKADFIATVREERRLEFAFEFNRWYDIKRWGILEEVFTSAGSLEPHNVNPQRDYLFPVPQTEVDITGFPQNNGY
ncbi:MAG: hypothetical protein ABS46_05930 [Cytophagaceae bacterium SCN 52-12]|nr:MAG: hypothetical protein ABS46_05930 [Cytophagaceae bacterium SCN 52-12]